MLVVDYPPEECAEFAARAARAHGIDPIFLLAPTSHRRAHRRRSARLASGYVYYVSLKGVTGAGHLDIGAVAQHDPADPPHVELPVGVGFGIRDARDARGGRRRSPTRS